MSFERQKSNRERDRFAERRSNLPLVAWTRLLVLAFLTATLLGASQSVPELRCTTAAESSAITSHKSAQDDLAQRVVCGALRQTTDVVIYSNAYREIDYPNGDVPKFLGACVDVVIRAYRAVGIDLQTLVHEEIGGDPNIAHRQVRNLRQLFARRGQSLPIDDDPMSYRPGDIVTYALRPLETKRDHIAIVSDRIGRSGQPLIIHNKGLGPVIDDTLFAETITGHYRFLPVARALVDVRLHDAERSHGGGAPWF